jgi:hypothetical protein
MGRQVTLRVVDEFHHRRALRRVRARMKLLWVTNKLRRLVGLDEKNPFYII